MCRACCCLFALSFKRAKHREISQHTQTSPFMVPEWPTRLLTFFHSHFLQFFIARRVIFARDSFTKVGVTCRVSLTLQVPQSQVLKSRKFEVKVCTFISTQKSSFEVKVKFQPWLQRSSLVYSRKFTEEKVQSN